MNLHAAMKRAADEEQLKLNPLPKHIAASQSETVRLQYALLLCALLSAQPTISEHQSRLTCLLLDALSLGDIRGSLFEQSRALSEESTLQAARLIREVGLAPHLLVDALVLLRLDIPLDNDMTGLIGEFASFLDVSEKNLKRCSRLAVNILGLGATPSELIAKEWPGTFRGIGQPGVYSASGQANAETRKVVGKKAK